LNEEELALFDILAKPAINITKKEESEVKKVAKELLVALRREIFVLDWRKKQ
jgi:type I restriction enzyme R subunit